MNAPGPIEAPATTTACAASVAPSPIKVASAGRSSAEEVRDNTSGLPTIAASWMRTPAPSSTPAWMTTFAPSSMSCGTTTSSSMTSPGARSDGRSTRASFQGVLQPLEHAHDAQPAATVGDRSVAVAHTLGEVQALHAQRLVVGNARAPDIARACDVLAVRAVVLVEALVVDDELLLQLHVVERGHLVRADDRE